MENLFQALSQSFDSVGFIKSEDFYQASLELHSKPPLPKYQTMAVVAYAYPKRIIPSTKEHFVPSFYTFGQDYHLVLKARLHEVMKPYSIKYEVCVDNHEYNERLAAVLAGIGYFAKNQLVISSTLGSYFFLGILFLDTPIKQTTNTLSNDNCGDCQKCIQACPAKALHENRYEVTKCISYFNQSKALFTPQQTKINYCLFGCDICQLVCPKNQYLTAITHDEFQLSGKEKVSIEDLFTLSHKTFSHKYSNMAYLWKGKTILMRNAISLLLRQNNTQYNHLLKESLLGSYPSWYKEYCANALMILEEKASTQ